MNDNDLDKAIQEFEDHLYRSSLKPEISDKSKMIAYRMLLEKQIEVMKEEKPIYRDVPEVKHGKWIINRCIDSLYIDDITYTCSICKESFVLIDGTHKYNLYKYCPNCGAKMDGDNHDL